MNFRAYITLTELKQLLGNYDSSLNQGPYSVTQQDDNMRAFILDASRLFDEEVSRGSARKRSFAPVYETRYFNDRSVDYPLINNSGNELVTSPEDSAVELYLYDDLLAVNTLTTKNGGTTISPSDYWTLRRWGPERTPYDMIRLKESSSTTAFEWDTDPVQAHAVTGWWGYHEDWANAWVDSGDALNGAVSDTTTTTITVNNVDGTDLLGRANRIKEYQLIRIDTEYMFVVSCDVENNTCTVVRGANGTTAATHTDTTTIYTFEPQREARTAVWTWAIYLLNRKTSVGGAGDAGVTISNRGDIFLPGQMPPEVRLYAENLVTARL